MNSENDEIRGPAGGGYVVYKVKQRGKRNELEKSDYFALGVEKTAYDSEILTATEAAKFVLGLVSSGRV